MAHNLPSARSTGMPIDDLLKLIRTNSQSRQTAGQNTMPNLQFPGQAPDPLGLLGDGGGSGGTPFLDFLQSQGTKIYGGNDPTSGINWKTGRQGVGGIGGQLGMSGMLGK